MTNELVPWLISNFKPKFSGDPTVWNRILNIALDVQFIDKLDSRWDEDAFEAGDIKPKDSQFIKDLYNDKEGILRWIVNQTMSYYKENGWAIPERIKK